MGDSAGELVRCENQGVLHTRLRPHVIQRKFKGNDRMNPAGPVEVFRFLRETAVCSEGHENMAGPWEDDALSDTGVKGS